MSVMREQENQVSPIRGADMLHRKRGRNLAMVGAIFACSALFYVITILRMF
jgi:hypothetical protein